MQELIKIEEKNGSQLVDARTLHDFLGIQKDFSTWIKAQFESLELVENEDFIVFPQKGENSEGRPRVEYALSIDTAKHISMASRTDKGKKARKYFIEVEKAFKQVLTPKLSVLDTLKIAIAELEQKEIIIQEKSKQIEVMKPSHEFVNKVFKTAATNVKVGDFAQASAFPDPDMPRTIIGQNKMFKLLKKMGILKNDNKPMTDLQNRGYFEVVERMREEINKVFFTTYVTPKGQTWLYKKVSEHLCKKQSV